MKCKFILVFTILSLLSTSMLIFCLTANGETVLQSVGDNVSLPTPKTLGSMSVEESIAKRRSIRDFAEKPLTVEEVSQILWAAQGVTNPTFGLRSAPSAGGTYPIELYLIVGKDGVEGITEGVYVYIPKNHTITEVVTGDARSQLQEAALNQQWVGEAPTVIVIAAVYERTTAKYGERGNQYVHVEAGCVAENIYLQAVALDLGTVIVGAFHDKDVQDVLSMPENVKPLGIMPVGRPASAPPQPAPQQVIHGFPIESIILGICLGGLLLTVVTRRFIKAR